MPRPQPGGVRLSAAAVLLLGAVGSFAYARALDQVYPIQRWLFWKLAMVWGWSALFSLACLSFGQLLLVRGLKLRYLPGLESALLSMAIGVVCFTLAMYVAGGLGWFRPSFAVCLPLVLLGVSAKYGVRLARRLIADAWRAAPSGVLRSLISAAGVLCVGVIYLGAMTPDALNYDSSWCHLTVAQDYARAGRIIAFPADYTKNMPQLASLIHTWGWLLPGLDQPLRWMLALQNEFCLFLWTLLGVEVGVRRLLNDQTMRGVWPSFFLFPIIFVYDNNLGGAADHVCAFFCVPMLLVALRVCRDFSRESSALLGLISGGALLTKYQAVYVIVPMAAVIAVFWLRRLLEYRRARRVGRSAVQVPLADLIRSPLWIAGIGALCVLPHFVRLAVFYANPVYPFLQDVFTHSSPTQPKAAFLFRQTFTDPNWAPHGSLLHRFAHACQLFVTFSFRPHYSFTREVPAFGSVFTLLMPALLVVRDRTRLLIATCIASGALLIWGAVYYVDRNLQIFLPLIVCVTAALIVKTWRLGSLARVGVILLTALQIVWGGDALFYSGYQRMESAIDLIRSGFEGRWETRFSSYRSTFVAIGNALPRNARVLLHTSHVSLGIDRDIVLDWIGFQSLISYDRLRTPRELFDYYRTHRITHFLYEPGARPAGTRQEEVLWNDFVLRYAIPMGSFGGYRLLRMPEHAPPAAPAYRVAVLGLHGYADGVYPIAALNTDEYLPREFQRYPKPSQAMPTPGPARDRMFAEIDAALVGPGKGARKGTDVLKRRFARTVDLPERQELYLEPKNN